MAAPGHTEIYPTDTPVGEGEGNELELFLRYFVANILPYAVVFGSVFLKLPQIATVLWHRSAEGLSLTSMALEITSQMISASWGIAQALNFKDFGESAIIMGEVALLLLLVGYLQKHFLCAFLICLVEAVAFVYMSHGLLPLNLHEWLLNTQVLLGLSSRVPQIFLNYRNKSTGQLSFVSYYLATFGGISRLLTTFHNVPVEKGKYGMLMRSGLAVGLNVAILLQILCYRRRTLEKLGQEKSKMTDDKKRK